MSPDTAGRADGVASRAASAARLAAGMATADLRRLPEFVIIGAQRSGTTSLYRWLVDRPDVARSSKKEVHYFDNHYDRSLRWYRAHFPIRGAGTLAGESSPYLLLHPLAPSRAARDLPDTKFIALLRDPVERAISNHWLRTRIGAAKGQTLEEALDIESDCLDAEVERLLHNEVSLRHMAYAYRARGEYAPQLRRWFDAVGRERVLVLESERLGRDPGEAHKVLDRLGLPDLGRPFPSANHAVREVEADPATVARLREHFEPYNQDLFELLGYELWTGTDPG